MAPKEIAAKLIQVLEEKHEAGEKVDLFTVRLHPTEVARLMEDVPHLSVQLGNYLIQAARQGGLHLATTPQVVILADESVTEREMMVTAELERPRSETKRFERAGDVAQAVAVRAALRLADAFIIVNGRDHVSLDTPLVAIGRRNDNDIVLPSATVSRQHAQIRWRYGRFVLYDMGSRAGTYVNNERVAEWALHPGDVIQMSDMTLIYGEGAATGQRHAVVRERLEDGEQTRMRPQTAKLKNRDG